MHGWTAGLLLACGSCFLVASSLTENWFGIGVRSGTDAPIRPFGVLVRKRALRLRLDAQRVQIYKCSWPVDMSVAWNQHRQCLPVRATFPNPTVPPASNGPAAALPTTSLAMNTMYLSLRLSNCLDEPTQPPKAPLRSFDCGVRCRAFHFTSGDCYPSSGNS